MSRMKNYSKIWLVLLGLTNLSCSTFEISRGTHWKTQVEKVAIGMNREEVEKLLPPESYASTSVTFTGGAQSEGYWLDEKWYVTIIYDYSGVERDENGRSLGRISPMNKVIGLPRLYRKDIPPPLEVKIEGSRILTN